jgi:hypothetical protein
MVGAREGPNAGSQMRSAMGSRELGAAPGLEGRQRPEQDRWRSTGWPP